MILKDITIKGVPGDAEKAVKYMASVAVERYYKKDLVISEEKQTTFETNIDNFLVANSLTKKYDVVKEINE